jgi:hypothetical protein
VETSGTIQSDGGARLVLEVLTVGNSSGSAISVLADDLEVTALLTLNARASLAPAGGSIAISDGCVIVFRVPAQTASLEAFATLDLGVVTDESVHVPSNIELFVGNGPVSIQGDTEQVIVKGVDFEEQCPLWLELVEASVDSEATSVHCVTAGAARTLDDAQETWLVLRGEELSVWDIPVPTPTHTADPDRSEANTVIIIVAVIAAVIMAVLLVVLIRKTQVAEAKRQRCAQLGL